MVVPLSSWAWRELLGSVHQCNSVLELSGIMGATQIAKYLPGNVAQHASRAVISLSRGMPADAFLMTTVVETLLSVVAAVMVTVAFLAFFASNLSALPEELRRALPWLALALPMATLLVPWGLAILIRQSSKRWAWLGRRIRGGDVPRWSAQCLALAAYTANYLLIGVGFLAVARSVGVEPSLGYFELTAAFAASWVVGFFAPGIPAGLGVREGVMAMMLIGDASNEALLGAIAIMRIATIAGDFLWFLVGNSILNSTAMQRST